MGRQVVITEFLKLRRSRVTWATLAGFSLAPLGIAFFLWILREPGLAAELGLLGAKANISGLEPTWAGLASAMTLIVGVGGMLLLAFIVAYVFGREYDDGTAPYLYALPVGRHWFVLAKLLVTLVWWLVLVVAVMLESLLLGLALQLPGFSASLGWRAIGGALLAATVSYLLTPVVAWVATAGRGLSAVGFAVAMLALGNLFGRTGWAEWFPWSIVPLLVGMVSAPTATLPPGSYLVLAATFGAGVAATILQVRFADVTR